MINWFFYEKFFYFAAPKNIRLNSTHYFIMEIIIFNHLSGIGFKDFTNLHKKCTTKPYSILVIDTTLASDNPFCFRKGIKT